MSKENILSISKIYNSFIIEYKGTTNIVSYPFSHDYQSEEKMLQEIIQALDLKNTFAVVSAKERARQQGSIHV